MSIYAARIICPFTVPTGGAMYQQRNRWEANLYIVALCLAACMPTSPPEPSVPPIPPFQKEDVVIDGLGRVQYIVDIHDGTAAGYPKVAPTDGRFPSYAKPEARNLIYAFERKYDLRASSMTSWVGISFAAFMTPEQVE